MVTQIQSNFTDTQFVNYISMDMMPYPGNSTEFKVAQDWNQLCNAQHCRSLIFASSSNDLFPELKIWGYKDGSIKLCLEFVDHPFNRNLAKNYLMQNEIIEPNFGDPRYIVLVHCVENQMKLINILAEKNTFPKEEIKLVRELIAAQNWKIVTPRQAGQDEGWFRLLFI